MATLFGLTNTDNYDTRRFTNHRRQILYSFPNGTAPLTALLSLCEEDETDDPHFRWFETRVPGITTRTLAISTTVVFGGALTIVPNTQGDSVTAITAWAADTAVADNANFGVRVADSSYFSQNMVVMLRSVLLTGGTRRDIIAKVIAKGIVSTQHILALRVVRGVGATTIDFDGNVDVQIDGIGSANAEGSTDQQGNAHQLPIEPENYTQIFRHNYKITGTNLKTAVKMDEAGPFPDQAKQNAIQFAKLCELAYIFGERAKFGTERYTGGLLWFIRQWEAADSLYRGGTGAAAATTNTDDNKRIIDLTNEPLTEVSLWNYLERTTRTTGGSNAANEMLVYCGNQAFLKINELLRRYVQITPQKGDSETFGLTFTSCNTPIKKLMFQSHPLFNENPLLRRNLLFLEPGNLHYRYLTGRDMQLKENQQPRNADYREDGWFGESGLEVHYPEKMLWMTNLLSVE